MCMYSGSTLALVESIAGNEFVHLTRIFVE